MALEWMVLGAVVAVEAVLLLIVTSPLPTSLVKTVVNLYRQILQPMLAVIPFALFQLLDVYWKYEHRISCTHEHCTTTERDRFEKSMFKSQRNGLLALAALFLYWMLYRYVYYINELQRLEANKTVKEE
ncbi:unnamed protein product [Calypogeia fissa]